MGNTCVECNVLCKTCKDEPTKCTSCNYDNVLVNYTCQAGCQVGYYKGIISGPMATCFQCNIACQKCDGDGYAGVCTSCNPGFYYTEDLKQCSTWCPPKYSKNLNANANDYICQHCVGCLECDERSLYICTSCEAGKLLYRGSCYSECPVTTYLGTENNCLDCNPACEACTGYGEDKCKNCSEGFYLINGTYCDQYCRDGYI